MKAEFRIGTRGSKLALYQAELVKTKLEQNFHLCRFPLVKIKTSGDMIRHAAPNPFLTKRIFTKEIEEALARREIDLAVHSAKDLSVTLPPGLVIGAVLEREDPRDCLVSREGKKLNELPMETRVGTGSARRRLQLLRLHDGLMIEEIHGNVDSRVRKLDEGAVDALVLAYAGLKRLGLANRVTEIFPEEKFFPAPGQGAIVIETRSDDREVGELLHPLHHPESAFRVACERSFLRRLEGGCQLPCGITTRFSDGNRKMVARGILFSLDGNRSAEGEFESTPDDAEAIGIRLADEILTKGGHEIIQGMRREY